MQATNAVTTHSASLPATATILGNRGKGIPIGGTIRSGIKVLTRRAAENAEAVRIYNQGVSVGQSFDFIEKKIKEKAPTLNYPLVPKNVPYFTVRADDFPNPETAKLILEKYGEDRGDGRRLYRFPVVFAADRWQEVMPHSLSCYTANERRYWSEYDQDGVRHCLCRAPVAMQSGGGRAIRVFGGRKTIQRAENGGVCNPEACSEYQTRQCNLAGKFIFYIPGIKSLSAIQLQTRSFYAMDAAIQKFEAVSFMRSGRLAGYLNEEGATFFITKKLQDTTFINEGGEAVTAPQWVIELEAEVDVAEMLRAKTDSTRAIARASTAAALLENSTTGAAPASAAPVVVGGEEAGVQEAGPMDNGDFDEHIIEGTATTEAQPAPAAAESRRAAAPAATPAAGGDFPEVTAALDAVGIDQQLFLAYADQKFGLGWRRNQSAQRRVAQEIRSHQSNPQALLDQIASALAQA